MTNNEKKFWDILTNLFVGAEVKGKSGFINLMVAKQSYFKKVKVDLLQQINDTCKDNKDFKDELYDKLYSFFHRYFSESGSIYYNYTPLFYNVYTKAYNENPTEIKTFSTDYEQVISNKQDTSLFYKTQMLYYVKSDKIFRDLEIDIGGGKKYVFDVSNMEGKKANEKKNLVYELKSIENKSLSFNVIYSEKGKTTKTADIVKVAKKSNIELNEEELKKAFQVFEKQSNVDYFINKDAKRFLTEQLDMWIYQYMFSQEVDFNMERFTQIQDFKKVASKLINFISQFENELVKIWNKPRFVINSNIVVTIDKLIDKGFEIDKLRNHPNFNLQQQEWEELGISQSNGLVENKFLPIDTKYFTEFKDEIESLFSEDEFDGLLIKSENYQALNTILPRFKGKVDLIYIDPPFNTGDDFAYIDRFQDSTWLSLMENRLEITKEILSKRGSFYLHLDHNANYKGRFLLDKTFGKENFINEITWKRKGGSSNPEGQFDIATDNIFLICKNRENYIFNKQFVLDSEDVKKYVEERFNNFDENNRQFMKSPIVSPNYRENLTYDYKGYKAPPNGWSIDISVMKKWDKENKLYFPEKGERIYRKIYLDEYEGQLSQNLWTDIYVINPVAKERIQGALTQKPEKLLDRILKTSSFEESLVLDYHLGSGTTVATAQKLNRKYIGIEMGEHFYTVIIPRMKKVLSGFECGISKDVDYKGSGLFKYYELEQYEQILRSTVFADVPNEYLNSKESHEIKNCFLFDEKLSKVISTKDDKFEVDLEKLYPNIDLKETIHNLTGKRPKEITDTKVIFEDKEFELLEILKPLLVW